MPRTTCPPEPPVADPPSRPATHGNLTHRAAGELVEALEEDIVLGRLHPRERLVEDVLIERFEAKRHTVREALAALERMGLVQRVPNRGAFVRELTPTEVENLYAVRELLELEAARRVVARCTGELVDTLSALQRRHDAATRARDMASAFRLNIAFHRAFFERCGNPELLEAIEAFGQKAHGIRSLSLGRSGYLSQSGREHWAIVRALERRDAQTVVELCRKHIQVARDIYIEAFRARAPDGPREPAGTASRRRASRLPVAV